MVPFAYVPPSRIDVTAKGHVVHPLEYPLPYAVTASYQRGDSRADLAMELCCCKSHHVSLYVYPQQEHFHVPIRVKIGRQCESYR